MPRREDLGRLVPLSVALAALGLCVTTTAQAQERGDRRYAQEHREFDRGGHRDGRDGRFEQNRREDRRDEGRVFERRDADRHDAERWRFERHRGWRFEEQPGFWSPYYAWWWVDQRMVMLPVPTTTVVQYPNGQYELRGDGVSVPYYWVWVPYQLAAAPPPPPIPAGAAASVPAPPGPPPPPPGG
jgi:hypothetical protein